MTCAHVILSLDLTRRLEIEEVRREHPIRIVGPDDFSSRPAGAIDPEAVLRDPRFGLYCFDLPNDAALFVEVDDPVAVDLAPFYYQAQVEHAVGLVSMPLGVFHRLAALIPDPPKGLILVHSVGRCGSTLLSKVLQAVPSIHSLSEPDDLTQLLKHRSSDRLGELLRSSVKWRGKPRAGNPADQLAIKTRSEVIAMADELGNCFPNARHLFLYRDAVSWMRSIYRGWPTDRDVYDDEANRKMAEGWARTIPLIEEYRREDKPLNAVQIRLMAWIMCMEAYLRLEQIAVPTLSIRFEDLVASPAAVLERIFEFCDIGNVDWAPIEDVLSRDSQAGTIYDRESRRENTRELSEELLRDVRELVATRPLLGPESGLVAIV